jgi:hypothetical protein
MYGSFLFNVWGALISFTVYFIWLINQPHPFPIPVLIKSFIVAIVAFLLMYPVRYVLSYIFYTPEDLIFSENEHLESAGTVNLKKEAKPIQTIDTLNKSEFGNEDSEEVAKVVRTMLEKDE